MQILCLGRFVIVPYWLVLQKENSAIHTKAMPKYVASNMRGPKLVWVPSKSGWICVGTMVMEIWFKCNSYCWLFDWAKYSWKMIITPMPSQNNWSPSAIKYKCNNSSCGDLFGLFEGLQMDLVEAC